MITGKYFIPFSGLRTYDDATANVSKSWVNPYTGMRTGIYPDDFTVHLIWPDISPDYAPSGSTLLSAFLKQEDNDFLHKEERDISQNRTCFEKLAPRQSLAYKHMTKYAKTYIYF